MRDMNKITHSYTVQLAAVASGKLLLTVFIYLHERSGPRFREAETLSQISVNVM